MKDSNYKKKLVFGIIIMFIGASVVPSIAGNIGKISNRSTEKEPTILPLTADYTNANWKFDENSGNIAHDTSVHNNDGTIYGASWTTGYSGSALLFDGVSDYVDLDAHASALGFNKTDDLIFSFYFKSSMYNLGRIYSMSADTGSNPEIQIFLAPNGTIGFTAIVTSCGFTKYTTNNFNDNVWHYVKITYNGITNEPTLTIYVDNVLEADITHWVCPFYNYEFTLAKIGKRSNNATGYFNGKIDEFKIIKYGGGNEQNPPTITGPTNGKAGINYDFTFVANDPEGDDVSYYIDWGDGTFEDWFGPYPSGQEVIKTHKWFVNGSYDIKARSMDVWHYSSWGHHPIAIGNIAPYAPTITGPKSGEIGASLQYKFKATDYDGDQVSYYVDWGDGTNTGWWGPYDSGQEQAKTHAWSLAGDFDITAKAKDIYDNEGVLSEPYTVRIGDQAPNAPTISGPTSGRPGIELTYTVAAIDSEGDNVYYEIQWGDGTGVGVWFGPYASGSEQTFSHTWVNEGKFTISARAKDIFGKIGAWGKLIVTIPTNLQNSQSTPQIYPSPNPNQQISQQSNGFFILKTLQRMLNLQ
jgi:hypothetical protein